MAKPTLRETPIEAITKDETVLIEGLLQTMSLYSTKRYRVTFKFALTDKGIWTKSKKRLFFKSREVFVPYADIECFKVAKYMRWPCMIFYPKNGKKAGNRIFFDDTPAVLAVLKQYITQFDAPAE